MKQLAPVWYVQVASSTASGTAASESFAQLQAEVKGASQERVKRELANFLQEAARQRPLVLFIDDLHWADVSTIDALSYLASRFETLNVLIVATYRPSDMLLAKHPFLQIKPDLQARGACRELALAFLTEADIAEYLTLEFPDHRFPAEFARLIHAKTEGSPLFMADLLRHLRARGVIRSADFSLRQRRMDFSPSESENARTEVHATSSQTEVRATSWELAQALPDLERELPESVRGMIERKIAQLSEDDHKLLTAASVQGYEFDSAVLAQVLNLDADKVEERLEKLERVFSFVRLAEEYEYPNRTLTLRYRFVHVLYQNALYEALRVTRKAALSGAFAQTLESFHGTQAATIANDLARLWEAARDYERAADSFLQAAGNAAQFNAHREAVQLAERGLAVLLKSPETPERDGRELGLQLTRGFSLMSVVSWAAPEAGTAFQRARQLCQRLGDDPRFFAVLNGATSHHVVRAEYEIALALSEQMLQLAEQAQNPVLMVVATNRLAENHSWKGKDLLLGRQLFEQAIALDRLEYHPSYLLVSNESQGVTPRRNGCWCLWMLGYSDQALALAQEGVTQAQRLSHPFSLGAAYLGAGVTYHFLRDWQSCQKELEKIFALAEEYDLGDMLNWAIAVDAFNLAFLEPTEANLVRAKEGIAALRAKDVMLCITWGLAGLGEAFCRASRSNEGLAVIAEALSLVESIGERSYEADLWRIKGELRLQAAADNAQAEAERCYQKGIAIAQSQSAKSFELRASTSLARLWLQQGKAEAARQRLAEIYGWFTEGFDTADLLEAKALLESLTQACDKVA
ncbi:MAG: AAA family ATPase [Acidobacteria bacterium]|nr:AAA family ATPase [Acidobacteriota bacterium]